VAAGVAGYVGINAAALCAATELGLQPTLFHRADGTPLYAPFHLWQSIPAMLLAHGLVAGPVELVLTAGVVAYLQRANLPLLRINPDNLRGEREPAPTGTAGTVKVASWWWGVVPLVVIAVLTPLGLLAPGTAFGEAAPSRLWQHAVLRGYDFRHDPHPAIGYVASAAVGVAVIAAGTFLLLALVRAWQRHVRVPA
jgi:cobalt/nickel transport system permease protein